MRNGFSPEQKDESRWPNKRAAIFIASLVFHIFLVYGLFVVKFTLKIQPNRRVVRDVLIVSPGKITFLGTPDQYINHIPPEALIGPGTQGSEMRPALQNKELAEGKTGAQSAGSMAKSPVPPLSSSAPAESLSLGSRFQSSGPGKFRIDLSAVPDRVIDAPLGFEGEQKRNQSLLNYIRPGRFSAVGGDTGPGSAPVGRAGRGNQRASASFLSPGYDISPWARKVIDLVQLKWTIPKVQNVLEKSEIRISVVIEKNGTFSAFEILRGTDLEILNSAAVNSLKQSLPLPPLPDDFPGQNLPSLFVFTYDN